MFFKYPNFFKSKLLLDSLKSGMIFIGAISSIFTIVGYSLDSLIAKSTFYERTLYLILFYLISVMIIIIFKNYNSKRGLSLIINDNKVNIFSGDIFEQKGLKLIPFNEYFDTTVDGFIISKNTLNGFFLSNYKDNIEGILNIINNENSSPFKSKLDKSKNKLKYPIGCIKKYNSSFLFLAFTHFDKENRAYLNEGEYEVCLKRMWSEIDRVYENMEVNIPLIGSGVTRFNIHMTNSELLKCILCTLKRSNIHLKNSINIVLSKKTIDDLNLYDIKGNYYGI